MPLRGLLTARRSLARLRLILSADSKFPSWDAFNDSATPRFTPGPAGCGMRDAPSHRGEWAGMIVARGPPQRCRGAHAGGRCRAKGLRAVEGRRECAFPAHDSGKFTSARVSLIFKYPRNSASRAYGSPASVISLDYSRAIIRCRRWCRFRSDDPIDARACFLD